MYYFLQIQENDSRSFPYYHQSFTYSASGEEFTLSFQTQKDAEVTCYFTVSEGPTVGRVTTTATAPNAYQFLQEAA